MSILKLMQAIVVEKPGDAQQLQLKEIPIPSYDDSQVLVKIYVAGINFIDVYLRSGLYQPPQYPFVLGKEASGIVVAVGRNVSDVKIGDRVAFCADSSGSYAEYASVSADAVVRLPDGISFELAAAIMLQGLTAYYLSHETFPIKANDYVLIHAGAGGVGLLLTQMAKLRAAKIMTTVSTEDKAQLSKAHGADEVVLYTQHSFLDAAKKFAQDGMQVVYDSVGQSTFNDSLKALALRGMMVSYGQSSGPIMQIEMKKLAEKSLFLTRPTLYHYTHTKARLDALASHLFKLVSDQKINVLIGQRYPLQDAALAHTDLENRNTIGKSLLLVTNA